MQEHRITAEQAPGVRGAHYAGDRPTPEQLDQLYNVQLLPSSEIARQYGGVTRKTVTNWLEQAGIPRRRGKAVIRFLPQSAFVPPEEREDCLLDRAWEARPERRIRNKVICRLCFQQVSRLTGKTAHLSTHHEGMSGDEYARLMPGHRHDCFQHTAGANGLDVEKLMDDWCTEWATADEIRHWRRDPKLAQAKYIGCLECGRKLFGGAEIQSHTRKIHNWSLGQYHDRYPGAPTGSLDRRAMQTDKSKKRWHELKQLRATAQANIAAEQQLQEAEGKVAQLHKDLELAEAEVARLQIAVQGNDAKITFAVDEIIPQFDRLFSLPEIQANPRILLQNGWTHPDFSLDMITATTGAVESRQSRKNWSKIAAISFIATRDRYDRDTVKRSYNRYHSSS